VKAPAARRAEVRRLSLCTASRKVRGENQGDFRIVEYCAAINRSNFSFDNKKSGPDARLTVFCIPHTMDAYDVPMERKEERKG
jgi:hypothetical protein